MALILIVRIPLTIGTLLTIEKMQQNIQFIKQI